MSLADHLSTQLMLFQDRAFLGTRCHLHSDRVQVSRRNRTEDERIRWSDFSGALEKMGRQERTLVALYYGRQYPYLAVCEAMGISRRRFYRLKDQALGVMRSVVGA